MAIGRSASCSHHGGQALARIRVALPGSTRPFDLGGRTKLPSSRRRGGGRFSAGWRVGACGLPLRGSPSTTSSCGTWTPDASRARGGAFCPFQPSRDQVSQDYLALGAVVPLVALVVAFVGTDLGLGVIAISWQPCHVLSHECEVWPVQQLLLNGLHQHGFVREARIGWRACRGCTCPGLQHEERCPGQEFGQVRVPGRRHARISVTLCRHCAQAADERLQIGSVGRSILGIERPWRRRNSHIHRTTLIVTRVALTLNPDEAADTDPRQDVLLHCTHYLVICFTRWCEIYGQGDARASNLDDADPARRIVFCEMQHGVEVRTKPALCGYVQGRFRGMAVRCRVRNCGQVNAAAQVPIPSAHLCSL
eukprot:scaffold95233_cov74-Phaeocystis_antarctica.AAC.7